MAALIDKSSYLNIILASIEFGMNETDLMSLSLLSIDRAKSLS